MRYLSLPTLSGNEEEYVKNCINTEWFFSVGSYVASFEEMCICLVGGSKNAVATVNGTIHVKPYSMKCSV